MTRPILNISDVELQPRPAAFAATGSAAERFDACMGIIAPLIGALHFRKAGARKSCISARSPKKGQRLKSCTSSSTPEVGGLESIMKFT